MIKPQRRIRETYSCISQFQDWSFNMYICCSNCLIKSLLTKQIVSFDVAFLIAITWACGHLLKICRLGICDMETSLWAHFLSKLSVKFTTNRRSSCSYTCNDGSMCFDRWQLCFKCKLCLNKTSEHAVVCGLPLKTPSYNLTYTCRAHGHWKLVWYHQDHVQVYNKTVKIMLS